MTVTIFGMCFDGDCPVSAAVGILAATFIVVMAEMTKNK